MSRFFDLLLVVIMAIFLSFPSLIIALTIKFTSRGPVLHWSERIGKDNKTFFMPKFRTMKVDTPNIATDKLENPDKYITTVGGFLRNSSLDEVPQLLSVFLGDMKLVGPRPALFNQYDLIELRNKKGLSIMKPGITGWAQVNGRDQLSIEEKVKYDEEYLVRGSLIIDIYIIWLTIIKLVKKDGISH
jgi:O-antigen biosynthesis protein WbqP